MKCGRILLVDDHPLVRTALVKVLSEEFPACAASEAGDALQAKKALSAAPYDLAIIDFTLPGQGGIELLEYIRHWYPTTRVLIVSGYPEELFAVRALRAGASGCLSKADPDCMQLLCKAVKTILSGGRFVHSGTAEILAAELARNSPVPPHQTLSNREFDIFLRIGAGEPVGNIARDLNLSVKTVSTYRARLLTKMHMKNNAELIHYAIRNNLVL